MAGATDDLRRVHDRVQRQADAAGRPRGLTPAILEHARSLRERTAAVPRTQRARARRLAGVETIAASMATGDARPEALLDADDADVDTLAAALAADPAQLRQLRDGLADRLHGRAEAAPVSRLAMYGALLRAGLRSEREIVDAGAEAVALVTGGTGAQAQSVVFDAMRALATGEGGPFLHAGGFKLDHFDEPARCCPPFGAEAWRDRYDFYSPRSALTALLERVKSEVVEQIGAVGDALDAQRTLLERYGLWDDPAGTADVAGLKAATTKAEAIAAIAGMRTRLDDLAGRMRIDYAYSAIHTGAPGDFFATGGADDNAVSLTIIDRNGTAYDITPRIGWYDDDLWSLGWTAVPDVGIFDFDHIRLLYTSTNDWYFGEMEVRLSYAPDQRIDAILRPDQLSHDPNAPNQTTWDLVLVDKAEGWVHVYDEYTYAPRADSALAKVLDQVRTLRERLDWADQQIQTVTPNNVIHVRFDELVTLLGQATGATLDGEPGIARGRLEDILEILEPVRARAQRTDDERRLLFAIQVMLADSYVAQRTYPFAYEHLTRAFAYVLAEDSDYLWLKLAELFIAWGDSLYAQAGRDYADRLPAIRMYQKVTAPELVLTYPDGCEDGIDSLWIDVGPVSAADADRIPAWMRTFSAGLWRAGTPPIVYQGLHVRSAAIVPATSPSAAPGVSGGFVRIELDVSERRLTRDGLRLAIANTATQIGRWTPEWLRWHVGYETLAPAARRAGNDLRGEGANIRNGVVALASPVTTGSGAERRGLWALDLQVGGKGRSAVPRPGACSATLLREHAQLRMDAISSHLNFLGIHDEYVPAHRFKALFDAALRLAERATVLESRYLQFKDRAEVEALNQAEAAHLIELATTSREIAEERAREAELNADLARGQVGAAGSAVVDARAAADLFQQTYKIGIQQFADQFSFGLSLSGPSVGYSWGGLASTMAGQGYEDVFRLQKFEYEAKVRQAEGALRQLEFARSIAEVEQLIAGKTVQLERFRERFAGDRLRFLAEREMNASNWYRLAGIYEELLGNVMQAATRWAWLAERALEFEINHRVELVRMDYHTMPLGSERLASDIDGLQSRLMEFRERYRDVPNIIEREFHLSRDFHEAFVALTSPAAPVESNGAAEGLRRVGFTTTMDQYDEKIPGRYAFGRVFGVELEIQADVGTGLVTGYLENARLVPGEDGALERLSTSLVRVPQPEPVEETDTCPPSDDLDDTMPKGPWNDLKATWDDALKGDDRPFIDVLVDLVLGSSGPMTASFAGPRIAPRAAPVASLAGRAQRAGLAVEELHAVARTALGDTPERAVSAVNAYAAARGVTFRARRADLGALDAIGKETRIDPAWYGEQLGRQIELARHPTWERLYESWAPGGDVVVFKDLTPRYADARPDWVEDYVDYTGHATKYVLRVKHHDADCLTLSTYRREGDAQVFNPYESYDLLGIFGNCGIHMDWTLTLKAWTDDRPDPQPVFDRIREIIMRVWYHAAYERGEGPGLADAVQRSAMRLRRSTLDLSAYRDLYDEFATLVGDFDPAEPAALGLVREFTDLSAAGAGGWLPFDIDASLAPFDDHRIAELACVVTSADPQAMPDLVWALRRGETGPVVQGRTRASLADAVRALSAPAPAGFGGLNPRGRWYFRLAAADNPGASLALVQDVQIYMEFALPGGTP